MAQLNASDRQILKHPPTPETWECGRKTRRIDIGTEQTPMEIIVTCFGRMSGRYSKCVYCGEPKRRGAKLIWPLYEAACKKAGIEPGTRWPPKAEPTAEAITPKRQTKRKGA